MINKAFTVLFATDSNYVSHLATAIYSLLKNNKELRFRIVVLTGGISDIDQNKLRDVALKFSVPLEFIFLDSSNFDGLVINHHFQKSNYYRLFAADFIDDKICLYLDADVIVNGSIGEMVNVELGNYFLGAVENPGINRNIELCMHPNSKYFNSGVMLLNLEKWRQVGVKDAVISFVKKNPDAIYWVDQCGLNSIVDGNWLELNSKFNVQSSMLANTLCRGSCSNFEAVIVHFTGSEKPWKMNMKHPYKKHYWSYRNKTAYRSYLSDDFSLNTVLLFITPSFLKNFLKVFLW